MQAAARLRLDYAESAGSELGSAVRAYCAPQSRSKCCSSLLGAVESLRIHGESGPVHTTYQVPSTIVNYRQRRNVDSQDINISCAWCPNFKLAIVTSRNMKPYERAEVVSVSTKES